MDNQQKVITPSVIIQVVLFIILLPFLPLLISQHWSWWEAWVYALISILSFPISRVLAARRHPDIIAERARSLQHEDTATWDKNLAPFLGVGALLILAVIGLDGRFGWSQPFSLQLKILALLIILAGHALGTYALVENRFFSGTVRIQTDRDQQVISTGPYRWVRHPGYAGAILTYLATPIFLDSLWAFIPTGLTIALLVVRTALEDRFLQTELAGYRRYTKRVRYRLLPGVW